MLKTVSSITNAIGALNYKGTWNANTNSPALASGVGTKGDYYVVSVAGATALDGISNWGIGDWAVFNGSAWQRVEGGADLNGVNLSVSGTSTLYGNVTFNDDLTQGTAAKGVNFTANTPAAGMTSQLLNWYEEVTAASTACTGAITTAASWTLTRVGNVITLTLPPITGAATSSAFFEFGVLVPSGYRPASSLAFPCGVRDNDANQSTAGMCIVTSAGNIRVYPNIAASANFTANASATAAGFAQGCGFSCSWRL